MNRTQDQLFIGGRWTAPAGTGTITVISPNTGEPVGSAPEGTEADIDAAVGAAREAFDDPAGWSRVPAAERAKVLRRFADAIEARKDTIAQTVSAQNGMPIAVAGQLEAVFPGLLLRYYADLVENAGPDVRPGMLGGQIDVRRSPVGVVAAIAPWNFPQTLSMFKIAPALAAGCTVVTKPSPQTVLDSVLVAEAAMEAGLPPGVLNIVPGDREAGAHLVAHPGVDKVSFTGSTAAGRQIAETCGRLLRPVTLELGGKSATIILDDAELDLAKIGADLFVSTLANNGQTCFLATRILAPRSRYDEIVGLMSAFAGSMTVGDSLAPETQIGPLSNQAQLDRVTGYIAKGKAEGGRITVGGEQLDRPGYFVAPTVFADLDNNATVCQEEIFGPVLTVIPYSGDDDAVRIANESDYGLAGTVWTSDPDRGLGVADRLRTGSVGINRYLPDPVAPFGGVKASGIGRELGPEGLGQYQHLKSIYC
ncbi:aldehyde dehydrogenase [Amycolatopsis rhabdoformis]|uniref:Aldehyde dehydrogenase n=1 Tax=Amycolatopsis rhabdoformis TaxID=1448059 RepID=A0ABZ1I6F4_9PSEU|nr:aldehyde dehydrogenase [Amycolatopsis rhabdoformis]WSE29932.1 aldehyde dehydrogenase [Amycolatopsis rhabdoformis]